MPGLGLSLSLGARNPSLGGEQVIWKVAIFGAGTASSNGEYVWDGEEIYNGKSIYRNGLNQIYWYIDSTFPELYQFWSILDDNEGDTYSSDNLIEWTVANGASPAPSSALSYSQSSFISSITLTGSNPSYDADGVYTRASGGTTSFIGSGSKIIEWDGSNWLTEGVSYGNLYGSFFNWEVYAGDVPIPVTTNAVYSA